MTSISIAVALFASMLALIANGVASAAHPGALANLGLYLWVTAALASGVFTALTLAFKRHKQLFVVLAASLFQLSSVGLALKYGSTGSVTDAVMGTYASWSIKLALFYGFFLAFVAVRDTQISMVFVKIIVAQAFAAFCIPSAALIGMLKLIPAAQVLVGAICLVTLSGIGLRLIPLRTQPPSI